MSHEGKMRRGALDNSQGKDTDDAKYFLENSKPKEEPKVEKKAKKAKEAEDGSN